MSSATSDLLNGYEVRILDAVNQHGEIVGRFHLIVRVLNLPSPWWGKVCLKRLEQRGLIYIERKPCRTSAHIIRRVT